MPSKPCVDCHKHRPIFAKGKCRTCFAVWGKENNIPSEEMPPMCGTDGCDRFAEKRGYCDRHYRRFVDHGHTEKVKVVSRERQHREYDNWMNLKSKGYLSEEWQDFWTFVKDIGERPGPKNRLNRIDASKPYGPDNFRWGPALKDPTWRENDLQKGAERYHVKYNLKRYYGITVEQYQELLARQNGGCALCGQNTDTDIKGAPQILSVDHCHDTQEIRGLLCRNHNAMLGFAKDNIEILKKAIDYLERPQHTGWFVPRAGDVVENERPFFSAPVGSNICSVEGCNAPVRSKGLCGMHYVRFSRSGSTDLPERTHKPCQEPGCDQTAKARGFCIKHYYKHHKNGTLPPKQSLFCDQPPLTERVEV